MGLSRKFERERLKREYRRIQRELVSGKRREQRLRDAGLWASDESVMHLHLVPFDQWVQNERKRAREAVQEQPQVVEQQVTDLEWEEQEAKNEEPIPTVETIEIL